MDNQLPSYSVSELCKIIDVLQPCMDDYLYIYDFTKDFYYISLQAQNRFALPSHCFYDVEASHARFVYPDDYGILMQDFAELKSGQKNVHNLQYRWISKNGSPIWINCRGKVMEENGKPSFLIGCINEIGKKQDADNVSGLLGMSGLKDFLNDFDMQSAFGFLLRLGLDDFKEINEKLGNDYGDFILKQTSACIKKCMREHQHLYRLTGDEFIVVDFSGRSKKQAVELYKDIRSAIDAFVESTHFEAVYTISGGILPCHPNQNYSFAELMKFSEFSLSEAKRKGKNCSYTFVMDDYQKFLRRRQITQLLRQSLNHDFEGFEVYLQPLFSLEKKSIFGAESLLRFHSDEIGDISPSEIIPILEDTGLIIPVGKWVLYRAIEMQKQISAIMPDFYVSINVSFIQIAKSNIITEIQNAVEYYDVNPNNVIIELTESGMINCDNRILKLWTRLRNKGIHLALDDFGTGYSNFHYLHELQPDIIKIDRSFTLKAMENDYEFHILSLMREMAQSLNIRMCIEGIETDEDKAKMDTLQPNYYQGYYFGKPCCFKEFLDLLKA